MNGKIRPMFVLALAASFAMPASAQATGIAAQTSPRQGSGVSAAADKPGASGPGIRTQGMGPVILPGDFAELRIEPGDLLSVAVYDAPELSDAYRVDPGGELTMPLCGKVKVQGLTSPQAAALLEATLVGAQILNQPQVNVDVEQYAGRFVTVLGEVVNPGRVMTIAPTRLSDIVAAAGGLTALAGTRIKLVHGLDPAESEIDEPYSRTASNPETGSLLVRPGDTVLVPRTGVVYVLGAVYHPGGYVMEQDGRLNVAEALALSGGTLLTARTNGLRVIRRNRDGTVLDFALSYDGIAKGTQVPLPLQAEDIVYVPMSRIKATLIDATGIISTAVSATIYTAR